MAGKTPEGFSDLFFHTELKPWLPDQVLDFHTHIWQPDHWINYKPGTTDTAALVEEHQQEHQKYKIKRKLNFHLLCFFQYPFEFLKCTDLLNVIK